MFSIVEKEKSFVVQFGKDSDLRDAPVAKFKKKRFGSLKGAEKAAKAYGESLVELFEHTKNLSLVIRTFPELSKDKIKFHIDNIKNRTGVVGVYLEHKIDELGNKFPYAYTANYVVDGQRKLKRFPFAKSGSKEAAYRQAVAHRIVALNLNRGLLNREN